jgi:23S rRNA pseudouridine2605 synthase
MERLQKVLAQAGIASRRAAEEIILAGRVRVDGKIVRELGTQVDPRTSRVEVDGNKIVAEKLIYIVLHKPRGVVCTLSDPEGRPTILELLKDAGARVVPVGRLDFHTSGALLCTNDGEFAQALAHPKKAVPKVYIAKVQGVVDDAALERFGERIVIDGRPTQPAQVKVLRLEGDKTWLEITLREGRNRQVRRLGEATGFPVMRLARISHAGVTSEDLRPGQWRPLSLDELVDLKRDYGVPKKVRAPQFEPAAGKGGWDEGRAPGTRRVEPRFSAAKRREPQRGSAKRTEARPLDAASAEPARFDRTRVPRRDTASAEPARFDRKRAPQRDAASAEPARFDRKRAPQRDAASAEPARFDRKRAPQRDAASAGPARFDRKRAPQRDAAPVAEAKPFNAAHREKKRFNAKNAEPKPFEAKRTRGPAPRGEAPFNPKGGRRSNRAAPYEPKAARGPRGEAPFDAKRSRGPGREAPVQRELGQSPSRKTPNRPWEARPRSASEARPSTNSVRPGAGRASEQRDRRAQHAKHGGEQEIIRADRASGQRGRAAQPAKRGRK